MPFSPVSTGCQSDSSHHLTHDDFRQLSAADTLGKHYAVIQGLSWLAAIFQVGDFGRILSAGRMCPDLHLGVLLTVVTRVGVCGTTILAEPTVTVRFSK